MSATEVGRVPAAMPSVEPVPRVSVVIPCFNGSRYIAQTLRSVQAQTMSEFEAIVVDDCSTDDSVAIVEAFARSDARVRLLSMPRNAGAPAAPRNAGVAAARAPWIALLDADDLWHPRKLELQLEALHASGAALCSTRMVDFVGGAEPPMGEVPAQVPLQRITLRMQLLKYRTPTSSIVVDRELLRRFPFNEDLSYKAREDTDCFTRLHEYVPYSIKLKFPLVHYRLQAAQISGNKWKMVARHLTMLKKYRLASGRGLGPMAYVYTFTHFLASIYLRLIRRTL